MYASPSPYSGKRDPLRFVDAYSLAAIRRNEVQRGPLPGCERQDVMQQAHLELCTLLGPRYLEQIAVALSSGFRGTPEHAALKKAVWRAIGKARWRHDRREILGLPRELSFSDRNEDPGHPGDRNSIDLAIDLEQALGRSSPLEKQIWQRHHDGKSVRQIGSELGMDFRRVAEIRKRLLALLADRMGSGEGPRRWQR
jgi:hypothetical protein